ncbi:MAG TPA: SRPBCC family protein [Dehalococcoidia bacterium]|nr:SRPBCC family protein [Dehalococcoidia bacterium]
MKVQEKIDVEVPVSTAYNQWTQFEEFPRFMEGVKQVEQISDERLHWVADIGGERKEWYARITRQVPDEVIAWQSEGGVLNSGTVLFRPLDSTRTEIEVQMEYEPEDFKEQVGGVMGVPSRRVAGDLKRFKEFIEERGMETGGWRGEIEGGRTVEGSSSERLQAFDRGREGLGEPGRGEDRGPMP